MASSVTFGGWSGIDTTTIINQLVSVERAPLVNLQRSQNLATARQNAWSTIGTRLTDVSSAASAVASAARLMSTRVSSSDSGIIDVTGTPSAGFTGTFTVDQLASTRLDAVTGFSSAAASTAGSMLTLAKGASALGISSVSSSAAGTGALSVTQGSAAASITGRTGGVTLGSGESFTLTDGSGTHTVTVAAGTYATAAELATAVNAALASAGSDTVAAAEGDALSLKSAHQGSAHTLTINSGSTALGLTTGASAAGTDAVVNVNGTQVTLSDIQAGATLAVGSTGTDITIGSEGALTVGTSTLTTITAATLAELATAVNGADAGVSATVAGGTTGGSQLLLTTRESGTAAAVVAGWSGSTGAVETVREATDAKLRMGNQVFTRGSNSITDVIPGATLQLKQVSSNQVTITSDKDVEGAVAKVKAMVDAVNTTLNTMDSYAKVVVGDTNASGVLSSDSSLRTLRRQLVSSLSGTIANVGGTLVGQTLSTIGITINRSGTFTFDAAALTDALENNTEETLALLSRTGTPADSRISFLSSSASSVAGDYDVNITTAASQAEVNGTAFTSLAADETISVDANGVSFSYSAVAGMTVDQVAAGLSATATEAGAGLLVDVDGGALRIRTSAYGSSRNLTVTAGWGTGLTGTSTGTDVAGTIGGLAATGSGRTLTGTEGDADGIALTVSVTPADVMAGLGAAGTLTYTSGFASSLAAVADTARDATGIQTSAKDAAALAVARAKDAIEKFNEKMVLVEARIRRQYTALESALASLKSQAPDFTTLTNMNNTN